MAPENNSAVAKKKRRRGKSKDDRESQSKHSKPSSTSRSQSSSNRKRRRGPSQEALQLSEQLTSLSREKRFDDALKLYWDTNHKIRDSFHACIVVDLSARCGRITEGERVIAEMTSRGQHVNVATKTALIKGYAHSGKMSKAESLFEEMCRSKLRIDRPNTRTFNTLIRGCLWSAASVVNDNDISGGVVTAERAWKWFQSLAVDQKDSSGSASGRTSNIKFDISSYEYSVVLLCQGLRVKDAERRIEEMSHAFGLGLSKQVDSQTDQSLSEALAIVHLALARAMTVLGKTREAISVCRDALRYATASQDALARDDHVSSKRAFRDGGNDTDEQGRRTESNIVYRKHRLREVVTETNCILEICQNVRHDICYRSLARRLSTRLVYLSGGGSTELSQSSGGPTLQDSKMVQRNITNSLYYSYGLDTVSSELGITTITENPTVAALKKKDCNKLLAGVGLQNGIITADVKLDVKRIFSSGLDTGKSSKRRSKKSRSLVVELGAGFGDWIAQKAIREPTNDHIAVELRADRVAQIFARTAIMSLAKPVDNLCVVGADCETFLSHQLEEEVAQQIHVNHPEPPTQTFGAGDSSVLDQIARGGTEPAHMLNSRVIVAAIRCLKKNRHSRFTIVTDNLFYGQLICATIAKARRQNDKLFSCVDLSKLDPSFQMVDSGSSKIEMFEGQPNETIGYPNQNAFGEPSGESYFDRLWRAGGGTHADRRKRYIIVLSPQLKAS